MNKQYIGKDFSKTGHSGTEKLTADQVIFILLFFIQLLNYYMVIMIMTIMLGKYSS